MYVNGGFSGQRLPHFRAQCDKLKFEGMGLQPIRAQCSTNRYCLALLGIVTPSKARVSLFRHGRTVHYEALL